MDFQDCVKLANQSKLAYFTTADGDQPRVRPIGLWFADDHGFYFQTEANKAFYLQIKANKKVGVCFYGPQCGSDLGTVVRVAGEVELVDDPSLKARVLQDRPFLKAMGIDKPEHPLLGVFCVSNGEAFFWTMQDNMKESEAPRVKFGQRR